MSLSIIYFPYFSISKTVFHLETLWLFCHRKLTSFKSFFLFSEHVTTLPGGVHANSWPTFKCFGKLWWVHQSYHQFWNKFCDLEFYVPPGSMSSLIFFKLFHEKSEIGCPQYSLVKCKSKFHYKWKVFIIYLSLKVECWLRWLSRSWLTPPIRPQ